MTSHSIAPIPMVARYFDGDPREIPIITGEFKPPAGWYATSYKKRVSRAWLRKLKSEGVTHVRLSNGIRSADFSVDELLRPD